MNLNVSICWKYDGIHFAIMWIFSGILVEGNKRVGGYLDMDCAYCASPLSMDAVLALFSCLFIYLNVALWLLGVPSPGGRCMYHVTYLSLP